ncbi:MAG: hypothetical protein ACYDGN_16700 [Acidimicrobiales bacterium]
MRPLVWRILLALCLSTVVPLSVVASFAVSAPAAGAATSPCPSGQPTGQPPGQPGQGGPTGRPSAYPIGQCQLLLSSGIVPAGQRLGVSGSGYLGHSSVAISLRPGSVRLGRTTTNHNGGFALRVTIPASTRPGRYDVVATGKSAYGTMQLTAALVVTSAQGTQGTQGANSGSQSNGTLTSSGASPVDNRTPSAKSGSKKGSTGARTPTNKGSSGTGRGLLHPVAALPATVLPGNISPAGMTDLYLGAFLLVLGSSAYVVVSRRHRRARAS